MYDCFKIITILGGSLFERYYESSLTGYKWVEMDHKLQG